MFETKYKLKRINYISSCKDETSFLNVIRSFNDEEDFVVKITSTLLLECPSVITHLNFPWNIFDKIILTERTSIEEQYASWFLLSYSQNNGKRSSDEIYSYIKKILADGNINSKIKQKHLTHMARDINYYHQILKPYLLSQNLPTYIVTHELFQTLEYIDELNQLLNENFTYSDISKISKSSINYSKFIMETNLTQLIQNTNNE